MKHKKRSARIFLCLFLLVNSLNILGQSRFTYSPKYPRPGEVITFTYETNTSKTDNYGPLIASFVLGRNTGLANRDEILLERKGNTYTVSLKTDSMDCFVGLGFHTENIFVPNRDFYIMLYDKDKPVKWSNYWLSGFHQFDASRMGGDIDLEKARKSLDEEFRLYPDMWKVSISDYVRLLRKLNKADSASILIQREIEAVVRGGLKTETDYSTLESLYKLARLPAQAAFVTGLKREKFPGIKWEVADLWQRFRSEKAIEPKEQILADFIEKINVDENWGRYKDELKYFYRDMVYTYIENQLWTQAAHHIQKVAITDTADLINIYSDIISAILKKNATQEFSYAEKLAEFSMLYAKNQLINGAGAKPDWLTSSSWKAERVYRTAKATDLYARVLNSMGQYKKSYLFAKDAVLLIKDAPNFPPGEIYTNYALVAEKVIPDRKLKPELESFAINYTTSDEIKSILGKIYFKEKKSMSGFNEYYIALSERNYSTAIERFRKKRLEETASEFNLFDIDGKMVRLKELEGKVVVLYYWFSTCGPCLSSLPVMQKLVDKYKADKDVVFLFINSSERRHPVKEVVQKFLQENKYSFDVLLDESGQVAAQYNVAAYPTKMVIDRKGNISFRVEGYDGRPDKLLEDLSAMIEVSKEVI